MADTKKGRSRGPAAKTGPADNETITIVLDRAVALVLFEFLARNIDEEDAEPLTGSLDDQAELAALASLLVELDETLSEPLDDDYRALLAAARATVARRFAGR